MHVNLTIQAVRVVALAALVAAASPAKAEDTVHACIGASTDGQTLRQRGRLLAARKAFITCARDACPSIVRSHCARWLSEVEAAIPSVVVRAVDAQGQDAVDARLSIDGRPAALDGQPVGLDPGEHTLAIENEHGTRDEQRVLLVEGDVARRVTLRFPVEASGGAPERGPAHALASRTTHVPVGAWVLGGAGVAALGAATYFALAAKNQLDWLDANCSPHCTDAQTQTGRTDAALFDVFLGVGVAATAGALVWALAFPSRSDTAAWSPRLDVEPLMAGLLTTVRVSY